MGRAELGLAGHALPIPSPILAKLSNNCPSPARWAQIFFKSLMFLGLGWAGCPFQRAKLTGLVMMP